MKKIGIVTLHSAHNYGSVFQAYAMVKIMQKLGLDAKIIDYRHPKTSAKYEFSLWSKERSLKANLSNLFYRGLLGVGKDREKKFNDFIEKKMPLTKKYNNRGEITDSFDYLVCGSDQIWNPKASGCNNPAYYLDFGNKNTVRFSYAASSGGVEFAKGNEDTFYEYLGRLKRIGVREVSMRDYIKKTFGFESFVNPDPTFLLDQSDWAQLEETVDNVPEKFLLVYSIREMIKTVAFAAEVGRKLGLPVVHLNQSLGSRSKFRMPGVTSIDNPSPGQFLWLYHKASFVVSNTFHGNMFSVIYRKNFIWFKTDVNDVRILTLHDMIGLGNNQQVSSIDELNLLRKNVDYDEEKILTFKSEGLSFLKSIL